MNNKKIKAKQTWLIAAALMVAIAGTTVIIPFLGSDIVNASTGYHVNDKEHKDHDRDNFTNDPNLDPEADVEEGD